MNKNDTIIASTLPGFFAYFIKKQWVIMLLIVFFSLAWALDQTLWAYIFKFFIDTLANYEGAPQDVYGVLWPILTIGACLWIYIEVSFRLGGILASKALPQNEANMRTCLVDYVTNHSYKYFGDNFAGSIANKINDMPSSATAIFQLSAFLFIPAILALIIATTLFAFVHPLFAAILFSWVVLHIGICLFFSKRCDELSHMHAESKSVLSGKIVDVLTNITNVKSFARKPYEMQYLGKYQKDELAKHRASLFYIEKIRIALGFFTFLFVGVFMTWFMIYSWQHGTITMGELVFIFNATWNITLMAWISGIELPNFFKEVGVCKQALSLVNIPHEITDKEGAKPIEISKGEITFNNVSFTYVKGKNIFKDKSLTIEPGQKVGLVGFSGSGKTTFVNLIMRYFDIKKGTITIDGQNIADVAQDSLRSQISVIPQDTSLFHRTLMENIRYGNPKASNKEVMKAAKRAHCDEFIQSLEKGYHTLVGERGIKLSGGQRQRIAIARTMLEDAPILILDEATSALDSLTEKLIQESLEDLMQGKTTIVIAHRLSTLSEMDRILVFKEGEIVEDGSHGELIKAKKHYAKLWAMQAGGFLPESEDK